MNLQERFLRAAVWAAALAALANLSACGDKRDPARPPQPQVAAAVPATAGGPDPSVPPAAAVLPRDGTASAPTYPSTNQRNDISRNQESSAMPLPGQANDHSNTVADKPRPGL